MMPRYSTADDFRRSLDQRIITFARESGLPHDRLRKDIAFQRLVARFVERGDDRWALKGGVGILWRVDRDARATRDVDANWTGDLDGLERFLDDAQAVSLGDWFAFEIGPAQPLKGEVGVAHRFAVVALVAGREFSAFRLDMNIVPGDRRGFVSVAVHTQLLTFVHLDELTVPMISVAQQLAEKLHAVARTYESGDSSRSKDAFDSVLLAGCIELPTAGALRIALAETYAIRKTALPTAVPRLPAAWQDSLNSFLHDFPLGGIRRFAELDVAWTRLWDPILSGTCSDSARWSTSTFEWLG